MKISVVICTHNPVKAFLDQVLESLRSQTLDRSCWELILIDNGSKVPVVETFATDWHPDARVIVEPKLGLIHARIRGTKEARFEIIVTVDDDTPLFPDYLEQVLAVYQAHPDLGIIGGRTVPLFQAEPPFWIHEFYTSLAIRDLGEAPIIQKLMNGEPPNCYPHAAPILIAPKRACMLAFIEHFEANKEAQSLGRRGSDLASGEDNDINLFIYRHGYALGYFPQLKFYHIIPAKRMTKEYLARLQFSMNKSWIKVLSIHGILPWKTIPKNTVQLRKMKAWLKHKAWKSEPNYIRWRGACGLFEGLAEVK